MKRKIDVAGLDFMDRLSPEVRIWTADSLLVICAALWGLGFVAMKGALDIYPTFWLLFFRFGGATLLMGAVFFKRILKATRKDLANGAIIGCFLFLGMGVQTWGLNYTTAGKQAFLTASYVIMVPLIIWMLHRKFPGWPSVAGSFICFAGMGLLTSDASGPLNIGDILTVAAAVFFALQIIAIGRYAADGDPLVLTFAQFFVAAVFSLLSAPLAHGPLIIKGTQGLWYVFFATFFCTFVCFLIQNIAQKYTLSTHASILLGLESVFGVLSGIMILGEVFTLRMGVGCFLIFGAVLLVELAPAFLKIYRYVPLED